jgi:carboxyl-terminal processing protease
MSGLILQFAYTYTDDNRQKLNELQTVAEFEAYLKKVNSVELFAAYAEKNGLKRRNLMIQRSHKLLERYINSRIIYNMRGEAEWMEYLNADDPAISETLRLFKAGEAFPKKPEPTEKKNQKVAYDYRATHQRFSLMAVALS